MIIAIRRRESLGMVRIYQCEDSIEGIFTAIYDAWESKYGHDNIRIDVKTKIYISNFELFSEYVDVDVNYYKASKVASSIQTKISHEAYVMIQEASLSDSIKKGDIIYRFLILGYSIGKNVVNYMSLESVMNLFQLSRNVNNESHHFLGFVRFSEIMNHILLSKISPKNDILPLIAPHFSDRLQGENFIIYDEVRNTAILHPKNEDWLYMNGTEFEIEELEKSSEEEVFFRDMWKIFFESISIKERKNLQLQRSNLPMRFRNQMIEFK